MNYIKCNANVFMDGNEVLSMEKQNGYIEIKNNIVDLSLENPDKILKVHWHVDGDSVGYNYYCNGNDIGIIGYKNAIQEYFNQSKTSTLQLESEAQLGYDYFLNISINGKVEECASLTNEIMDRLFDINNNGDSYIAGYLEMDGHPMECEKYVIGESYVKIEGAQGENIQPVINIINEYENWFKESDLWFDFYTTFNDDNVSHAENAFYDNNLAYADASEIHTANVNWFVEVMERGHSADEICTEIPKAESCRKEAEIIYKSKCEQEQEEEIEFPF